jgi:hypothetical protein
VTATPSTERRPRPLSEIIASLGVHERTAAAGALVVAGSLLLPWYGVPFGGGLAKTGISAFGFVEAALLFTVGATLWLILERGRGRELPLPLHEGTLMIVAGVWAALLVLYRMMDRPDFTLGDGGMSFGLRYGIFVALAGATVLAIAGYRRRSDELRRERPGRGASDSR